MNVITVKDINLGGIADSKYQGIANSVADAQGLDLHSEPGIIKVNQKLTKESGTTIDDLVKTAVVCSDGNTYLFGSTNGKIWKRTSAGVYSLEVTASAGILDAREYQGYIYYSMQSNLGRVAVGAPTDWTTRNDSWATFTNTDADFHPIQEQNAVLYIGDKNYVAQVDAGVFSANALDIAAPYRIKALGKMLTNLLIGTFITASKVLTEVFNWNTWSTDSFQASDEIPEIGINSFLATDNAVLANAGRKGHIYAYDGSQASPFKNIPGDWSGTNEAQINPNASVNRYGMPLFGLSNISGNPAPQGVYSLAGYDRNYPKVLNLEYIISNLQRTTNIEIGMIALVGTVMIVSWKDTTGGAVYGVDKLDTTLKATTAYFSTRIISPDRINLKTLSCAVAYRSLPSGCTIKVYHKLNHAAAWSDPIATTIDTDRHLILADARLPEANTIEVKVELNSNGNNAPEVESAEFSFD